MTYSTFDLTEHTQLSIRGTTGTHPDSKFVFGVYIGSQEHYADEFGKATMPDMHAYDDADWSKAVELAKWVLDAEYKNHFGYIGHNITNNSVAKCVWYSDDEDLKLHIQISLINGPFSGGVEDICEWSRAVEMAKWILEQDEWIQKAIAREKNEV